MSEIAQDKARRSASGTRNAGDGFEKTGKGKSCPQVDKTGTTRK
jgi:hypothetical protein